MKSSLYKAFILFGGWKEFSFSVADLKLQQVLSSPDSNALKTVLPLGFLIFAEYIRTLRLECCISPLFQVTCLRNRLSPAGRTLKVIQSLSITTTSNTSLVIIRWQVSALLVCVSTSDTMFMRWKGYYRRWFILVVYGFFLTSSRLYLLLKGMKKSINKRQYLLLPDFQNTSRHCCLLDFHSLCEISG